MELWATHCLSWATKALRRHPCCPLSFARQRRCTGLGSQQSAHVSLCRQSTPGEGTESRNSGAQRRCVVTTRMCSQLYIGEPESAIVNYAPSTSSVKIRKNELFCVFSFTATVFHADRCRTTTPPQKQLERHLSGIGWLRHAYDPPPVVTCTLSTASLLLGSSQQGRC